MLPTRISFFILLSAFHLFNCVERSDWTYDRETGLVNTTTANGTTYSCSFSAIINRADNLKLPTDGRACLDPTQSENDTGCVSMDALYILNSAAEAIEAEKNHSACIYPVPTEEEVFEKIEKIYRSTFDDPPALRKWIIEVAKNITSMRAEYSENENAMKELEAARNNSVNALYNRASRLPKQRKKVSLLETEFELAKSMLAEKRNDRDVLDKADTLNARNTLLVNEIIALKDSYEFELYDWRVLSQLRVSMMEVVSSRKRLEHILDRMEQDVVERRMDMLLAMAEANEIVAETEYFMREVEYRFNLARQSTERENAEMLE